MSPDDIKTGDGFEEKSEELSRKLDVQLHLISSIESLGDKLSGIEHVIATMTVATLAGQIFTALAQRRNEPGYTEQSALAESVRLARIMLKGVSGE